MATLSTTGASIFQWTERYSVGVAIIDEQHKQIFKDINSLISLIDTKPSLTVLESVVDDMIDYVANHFTTEERLLAQHPGLAAHQAKHQVFADQALEFDRQLFAAKPEEMAMNLYLFLGAWLQNHILTEDRACFAYLRQNSLLPPQG
jgi:hemerythrin-like metal-binding protein